jgi:hypothetical protein
MPIPHYKNLKLTISFFLSSAMIFSAEVAVAETPTNTSRNQLEFFPSSELQRTIFNHGESISDSGVINQLKVTDLVKTNSEFPLCPSSHGEQGEFTAVRELATSNSIILSCTPMRNTRVDQLESKGKSGTEKLPPGDNQEYIIPPRIADQGKIHPRTTTMQINGLFIDHLTERQLNLGYNFNNTPNNIFNINGIVKLNGTVKENLTTNNILTVDQIGEYLQLQTTRQTREVTVSFKQPQTVLGTNLQLSMTGSCIFPGTNPEQICTYIPALQSGNINSDTLLPFRISQTATLGDIVATTTAEEIRKPQFQSGVENGQQIGIDLLIPNTGAFVGNSNGDQISIIRKEEVENAPVASYSRVRQIVKVNDREAVMGRTVRGFSFILNDDNTFLNTALQLGYTVLPDIVPNLASSETRFNSSGKNNLASPGDNHHKPSGRRTVNRNLFLAANNVRIPANSLTAYHGGIARAESIPPGLTSLSQVPAASFNGIWVGASPTIQRSSRVSTRFEDVGNLKILSSRGSEGGSESDIDFRANINNQNFSPLNVPNFYAQVYVTVFNQEANNVTSSKYKQETVYAPHLSFTGNITGTQDVLRYYTGVIGAEQIQVYSGLDYTKNTADRWRFSGAIIGYVNPDLDNYSQVTGTIDKVIPWNRNSNLVISTGVNYAFDREPRPNDFVNSINLRARANLGNVWFGLTNYFGDVLPDAIKNTLVTSAGIQFSPNLSFSAYYNPINENVARSVYGAAARWRMGNNQSSPTFNLSWSNNEYDFGTDKNSQELKINENVFTVFLRGNF